jgi:anhydro-N-acetylmuramic acid kinase
VIKPGQGHYRPYSPAERSVIKAAYAHARTLGANEPWPDAVIKAAQVITQAHIEVVQDLLGRAGLAPNDVDFLGFHGQTVAHDPARRFTLQVGLPDLLARATGVDVVHDFRSADVAAGGQGAPLVPLYHAALVADLELPVAILNLGGVGNVTFIQSQDQILAFDTGPGNALIDDWVYRWTGAACDQAGRLAAAGTVDRAILAQMMDHAYFRISPPKSLDRDNFSPLPVHKLSLVDGAATLSAFTAASVGAARDHLPVPPRHWLVTGGGRHNPTLMAMLAEHLGVPVEPVEAHGLRGDLMEAEAFGYLAVRSYLGLPLSLPGTTGVPQPQTGGRLVRSQG